MKTNPSTMNVVFIAGLYHSGSTLLDMMLAQHPRVVGLGEIYRVLTFGPEETCSCGAPSAQCPFWAGVLPKLRVQEDGDLRARLMTVLDAFQDFFGPDMILVDSSKHVPALKLLRSTGISSIKVIHLMRDVRSWTLSLLDRDRRAQYRNGRTVNLRYFTRSAPVRFLQWYRTHREIKKFVQSTNLPMLQIGYEELVFYTHQMIAIIWDLLDIEPLEEIASLAVSKSHIINGNPMRYHEDKNQTIVYDNRWLYRDEWLLSSLLFRNIMRYNSREVYSNLRYTAEGIQSAR